MHLSRSERHQQDAKVKQRLLLVGMLPDLHAFLRGRGDVFIMRHLAVAALSKAAVLVMQLNFRTLRI